VECSIVPELLIVNRAEVSMGPNGPNKKGKK
jgi:hypothetical protein